MVEYRKRGKKRMLGSNGKRDVDWLIQKGRERENAGN